MSDDIKAVAAEVATIADPNADTASRLVALEQFATDAVTFLSYLFPQHVVPGAVGPGVPAIPAAPAKKGA